MEERHGKSVGGEVWPYTSQASPRLPRVFQDVILFNLGCLGGPSDFLPGKKGGGEGIWTARATGASSPETNRYYTVNGSLLGCITRDFSIKHVRVG